MAEQTGDKKRVSVPPVEQTVKSSPLVSDANLGKRDEAIEKALEKPFRRELNILQKFTDGFLLPETAVLDAGFTNHGTVGVGFTSPNAVIHFVPIEARFNQEELANIQSLNQQLPSGKADIKTILDYRTATHPDKERVTEILAKSREIRDGLNDAGQFNIAPEQHAKSFETIINNVAAQYNEAIKTDATKLPVPPVMARASEGTLSINLNSLKTVLNAMPGLEKSLIESGTEYSKSQHAAAAIGGIHQQVVAGVNSKASIDAVAERVSKQLADNSLVGKNNPSAGEVPKTFANKVEDSRNTATERTR